GWLVGEALFQYSIRETILTIKLFGILPLCRMDLARVRDVSIVRLRDWSKIQYWYCERWGGYMLLFRGVALVQEKGNTLLIAPRNREKTVETVKAIITEQARAGVPGFVGEA
ncbi:MAG: hypothetical protein ACRD36_01645, partial [Candidatus Acidiferrum sp.]